MNKLIKIFLMIIFALAISCKSNEEPASEIAGENPPAGNYTDDYTGGKGTVKINEDGSCTIDGTIINYHSFTNGVTNTFNITVKSWYRTYNGIDYGYNLTRDYVVNSFTSNPEGHTLDSLHWGVNSYSGKTFLYFHINDNSGNLGSGMLYLN